MGLPDGEVPLPLAAEELLCGPLPPVRVVTEAPRFPFLPFLILQSVVSEQLAGHLPLPSQLASSAGFWFGHRVRRHDSKWLEEQPGNHDHTTTTRPQQPQRQPRPQGYDYD